MSFKVLITGGAGFIGSALGKVLLNRFGAEVTAIDNLLEQVHPCGELSSFFDRRIRLLVQDVRDGDGWKKLFSHYAPDYIVHFAAETGTAQSLTESSRHTSVNVVGTSEMLDALGRAGHRPRKILLSSSRSVYGEGAWSTGQGHKFYPGCRGNEQLSAGQWDFFGPDGTRAFPLKHNASTTMPNPSSIYAATKLAQEHILSSWCGAFNVPLAILRFQNVYGPGQSPTNPYTGIINIFHRVAASGGAIDVYEDGNIGRDFVFIDDVVDSCVAALFLDQERTFYADIGFGVPTTIHDAANMISEMHGAPKPIVSGKFRDGDIRWAVADTVAMVNQLKVEPRTSFEQGVRIVGEWLAESRNLLG